jgi:ATP-dependent RNA helicase MSS116, mitochondrial
MRLIAHDQLSHPGESKVIVFLQTIKQTQLFSTLIHELKSSVFPASRGSRIYKIHSKKAQTSRNNASNAFRNDASGAAVLVTPNVSARGVDHPGCRRLDITGDTNLSVISVTCSMHVTEYRYKRGVAGRVLLSCF